MYLGEGSRGIRTPHPHFLLFLLIQRPIVNGTIVDRKTVVFLSKSVKKSWRKNVRRLSPVSLPVFTLVPDLLFDCSRVLENALEIRTVLQSSTIEVKCKKIR